MPVPRHSLRRPLALLALALSLLAALPCAAITGDDGCCRAGASCTDETVSPCAQLAATPCCEAGGAPLEVTATAAWQLTATPCPVRVELPAELRTLASDVAPPQRDADIVLRSVVLRL
jgi:hypothetical protein